MDNRPNLDFALFVEMWNLRHGQDTPRIHCMIADWLQRLWDGGETQLLLMAFRSCGKSTLVGLFCAWLLWRDEDLRILVLAAESNLAGKMVRHIKNIIEAHPITRAMKPSNPDQWASDRFTISREAEGRDPSVMAAGIMGNITGSRADLIIYDDVEVPNTSDSADKRESLRARLKESQFILDAGGRQLFVGTPHHYYSIYAKTPRADIGEEKSFLDGYARLEVPIMDEAGRAAWPEKYSIEAIEALKAQTGPLKFESQMMLRPKNVTQSRLNVELLEFYDEPIETHEAQGQMVVKIMGKKMVSASAWWDPAFGAAKGDASVLAIIFADDEGRKYVHHVEYIKLNPQSPDDEATQQCKTVARLARKFHLPKIAVEKNGIGAYLPSILKRELFQKCVSTAVLEKHSSEKKSQRILESYDAIMAARGLYVHRSVCETPFINEMRDWVEARKNNKDDGLDAVAGALSLEPARIKSSPVRMPKIAFSGGGRVRDAKTDFDV